MSTKSFDKSSDPNSFSNPEEVRVKNMHIVLAVDFTKKILKGFVDIEVEKVLETATELILDTNSLKLHGVYDVKDESELKYQLDDPDELFGSKLSIRLPQNDSKIRVKYETDVKCSALQWLSPEQTTGGKLPFMFSQCQPIHCRSMIPCQDTPGVKAPYTAEISVSSEFTVVMSAIRDEGDPVKKADGIHTHRFNQRNPIPSYLIAIAVGQLECRSLGPRCHVWAEPPVADAAAYEFAETETMLKNAEDICGKYVWGFYDLLLMPPSFPFGGMENPCMTFLTPTLLAGDRSLACVIAHEISHSWTGNLVTNRNFEHFWLNEGFTMFVERKITGRMKGKQVSEFAALNGLNDLRESLKQMGADNPLTKLVVNLKGIDPDDAFSTCPYEKGFTFLFYLETQVGGPVVFEPFLKKYLDHYKYKSIDTDDFKKFFLDYFADNKAAKSVDWNKWLDTPGMPPIIPDYDVTLIEACTELATKWIKWDGSSIGLFASEDLKDFDPLQTQEFLAQLLLQEEFQLSKVMLMEEIYHFNSMMNAEIRFRWLRLCLKAKWYDAVPLAIEFATKYGRMKYVRPLFRDLYNWELTREKAVEVFKQHCDQMMHVTAAMVAKDLKVVL